MKRITDAYLLPRHPRIYSTETILPYILRLSEENGYSTPSGILGHARIQPPNLDSSFNLTDVARTANYPPSELFEHGYYADPTNRDERYLLGHHVRNQDLSLKWPKLCPECVGEKGFIEAHFDLAVMIACPVHKKLLVRTCTSCSQRLRWYRPGLLTCKCEAPILAGSECVEGHATTDLLDVIRRKVLRLPEEIAYDSEIPAKHLFQMSLRSLLFLAAVLGRIQSNRTLAVTSESSEHLVPRAANLLACWPNNFVRLLEEMTKAHPRGTPISLKKGPLAGLYISLRNGFSPRDDGAFIRDCVVNFCMNALDITSRDEQESSAELKSAERFVSVKKFAARHHIDPRTARRVLNDEQAPLISVARKCNSRNYVDLSSISVSPRISGKIHRIKTAASLLGLTPPVLKSLQAGNDFEVNHLPKGMRGIHEGDLNAFVLRLKARAPGDITGNSFPTYAICLDTIKSCSRYSTAVTTAIVRGILTGTVPVIARRDDSVGGLAIPSDILLQYMQEDTRARMTHRLSGRKNGTRGVATCMTTTETAIILGCSPLSIPLLIERGVLKAERWFGGWWISEPSLTKFKKTYTTVKAVADSYATLPFSIMQFCKRRKVPLVKVFLGSHLGNQAFVRITDVPSLSEYLNSLHVKSIRRRNRRLMLAA